LGGKLQISEIGTFSGTLYYQFMNIQWISWIFSTSRNEDL